MTLDELHSRAEAVYAEAADTVCISPAAWHAYVTINKDALLDGVSKADLVRAEDNYQGFHRTPADFGKSLAVDMNIDPETDKEAKLAILFFESTNKFYLALSRLALNGMLDDIKATEHDGHYFINNRDDVMHKYGYGKASTE